VAAPPLSEPELQFLRALERTNVRFMVVGLSAAALQGAPVVTQDVDLWFEDLSDPAILEAAREVGAAYVPPTASTPPMFAGGGIELFDIVLTLDGLGTFDEEFREALEISFGGDRINILPLERILVSKRAANRAKDRLVIPVLEDVLKVNKATQKRSLDEASES
jgi:hypothetical protein